MDWWGNPTDADTTKEDEQRYRHLRLMLQVEYEIVTGQEADPDSVINGGSGIDSGYRALDNIIYHTAWGRR